MEDAKIVSVAPSKSENRDVGSSTSEEIGSSTSETVGTSTVATERVGSSKSVDSALSAGSGVKKTWQKSVETMLNEYIAENFGVKTTYELRDGKIVDSETGEVIVTVPRSKLLITSSSELSADDRPSQEQLAPAEPVAPAIPTADEPGAC